MDLSQVISNLSLSKAELSAFLLSLKIAGTAVLVGLPIAFLTGFVLARYRFWGRGLLNLVVLMPLVMPPVVTGYLLLVAFGTNGLIGSFLKEFFDFTFAFRWTGAALAAGVMAFPLMVRPIRQAIEEVDGKLEESAKTLGASSLMVFFTVVLPLSLPGILAALVLGFAKALGEFGATITFVSNIPDETRTLPLAIFSFLQVPGGEFALWRMTVLSAVLAVVAVLISEILSRKKNRSPHDGRRRHAEG